MKWIDRLPLLPLAIVAVLLALAPFFPEPHLVEKLRLLVHGELHRPIDIFDLFLHGTPLALFVVRIGRVIAGKAPR